MPELLERLPAVILGETPLRFAGIPLFDEAGGIAQPAPDADDDTLLPQERIRGINAREYHALSQSTANLDEMWPRIWAACAIDKARETGYEDYFRGFRLPPPMLADVPALLQAWHEGVGIAVTRAGRMSLVRALDRCPLCGGLLEIGDHIACHDEWLDRLAD